MEAEECGYREIKRVLICPVWGTINSCLLRWGLVRSGEVRSGKVWFGMER